VSWLRLDDKFAEHPKILALTDREFRIHVKVLCYCARYRTGGRIPTRIGQEIAGISPKLTAKFLELELWNKDEKGILEIHDFDSWNPGDPHGAERARRYRDRVKGRDGDRDASSRARAGAQAQPVPSLLVNTSSSSREDPARPRPPDADHDDDDFKPLERLLRELGWQPSLVQAARQNPELASQWAKAAFETPGIDNRGGYAWSGYQSGEPPPETVSPGTNLTSRNTDPAALERYVRAVAWQYEPASLVEDLTERGATPEQISQLEAIAAEVREAARASPAIAAEVREAARASPDEAADSSLESAADGGMRDAGDE
jgi:hypothetical protein